MQRSLVLAEEREGQLHLGVRLGTGDEFWKAWPGRFQDLVDQNVRSVISKAFAAWSSANCDSPRRMEFCDSHVGDFVRILAVDSGSTFYLDSSDDF